MQIFISTSDLRLQGSSEQSVPSSEDYLEGRINAHPHCPGQDNMGTKNDHTSSGHKILATESGSKKGTQYSLSIGSFPLWSKTHPRESEKLYLTSLASGVSEI